VEEHDHQDEEVVKEPKQPQHACAVRNIRTLVHSWIRSHWRVRKETDSYFQEGCRLGSGHRLRSGPPTKFESGSVSGSCLCTLDLMPRIQCTGHQGMVREWMK
jgi:hypothetical protein